MRLVGVLCVLVVAVCGVTADYNCVCNENIYSVEVYQEKTKSATVIGHIDYAQCKHEMCSDAGQQWITIEYETQFGYLDRDSLIAHKLCPGTPPSTKATSPCATTTVATTTTMTTTKAPSTPAPTTQAPTTTTPAPTTIVTTHAPTHAPNTGNHGNVDGDVNACPLSLRVGTTNLHDALGHFGTKCYALDPRLRLAWGSAEATCAKYGAHLVHITSAAEQTFVHKFVATHAPGQAMWIGLNDMKREGAYSWSNGGGLHYNHWAPHHTYHAQRTDDCVVMRTDGYWDDIGCGYHLLGRDHGTHIFACEFDYGKTQSILG